MFLSIQKYSEKNNLPVRNPENLNNNEEYNLIKSLSADIAVVVAYGKLIPKNILKTTKHRIYKHPRIIVAKMEGGSTHPASYNERRIKK